MNIFVLADDPAQAARDQCNKHVVKMVVESAQLLCTALALGGTPREYLAYRPTHVHHPCTTWLLKSKANIAWLFEHANELNQEYTRRYGRKHKTGYVLESMTWLMPVADWHEHTPFAQVMPQQWRHDDAVTAYRAFYIAEKARFARWKPRASPPSWWPAEEQNEPSART